MLNEINVPKSWQVIELGKIAERITKGATPTTYGYSFQPSGINFIKVENIKKGRIDTDSIRDFISEEAHKNQKKSCLEVNDILFSIAGTIGETSIVTQSHLPANTNQALAIIRGTDRILIPVFLKLQLDSFVFRVVKAKARGGAMNNVSLGDLMSLRVFLPPLAEQNRIVAKIEELFSDLDAGIESLKTARAQLKIYRQAVLKWAFEGKLTAEWRKEKKEKGELKSADELLAQIKAERENRYKEQVKEWEAAVKAWDAGGKTGKKPGKPGKQEFYPSLSEEEIGELGKLPPDWIWEKSGNICQSIVPNRDKPKSFSGSIPWLTTPDIEADKISINLSQHKIGLTKDEVCEYNARLIPKESVIMTCVGTFGVICINSIDCVINQQLHAFIIHPQVFAKFLAFALKRQTYWMEDHATATTVSYLNKTSCNSVPIPVCSLAEQLQIIQAIESRLSICDSLEATITENLQRSEALRQSILKHAFEGKLVPQDPNDEPAAILLERIRAAKASQSNNGTKTKETRQSSTQQELSP